ncbi:MAG: class I SAM-dependent methyltransferase [Candidatus Melainabacteria bacterium]|nr:class I SAM-dependent methyltransferase [Candidatus Melainabacteria bacterium]
MSNNESIVNSPIYDKVWKTDAYMAKINPAQIHRRRLTKNILKKLCSKPKSILDIGCGTGELLFNLAQIFPEAKLHGCDISTESGKLMKSILPNAKFYCLNVDEVSSFSLNEPVDLITCCEVLEHCTNPENMIRNSYQSLNPGGIFFLSVPSGKMTDYDKVVGHNHHYTVEEINLLLSFHGFKNISSQYWGAPFHTIYREIVRIASKGIDKKSTKASKVTLFYLVFCMIFNFLFYFNFFKNSGHQIFAWGIK